MTRNPLYNKDVFFRKFLICIHITLAELQFAYTNNFFFKYPQKWTYVK